MELTASGSERQQEISTLIPDKKIGHTSRRSHFQLEKSILNILGHITILSEPDVTLQ